LANFRKNRHREKAELTFELAAT